MNFPQPYGENEDYDEGLDPYRVYTERPQLNTVPSYSSSEEESDKENDANGKRSEHEICEPHYIYLQV